MPVPSLRLAPRHTVASRCWPGQLMLRRISVRCFARVSPGSHRRCREHSRSSASIYVRPGCAENVNLFISLTCAAQGHRELGFGCPNRTPTRRHSGFAPRMAGHRARPVRAIQADSPRTLLMNLAAYVRHSIPLARPRTPARGSKQLLRSRFSD